MEERDWEQNRVLLSLNSSQIRLEKGGRMYWKKLGSDTHRRSRMKLCRFLFIVKIEINFLDGNTRRLLYIYIGLDIVFLNYKEKKLLQLKGRKKGEKGMSNDE